MSEVRAPVAAVVVTFNRKELLSRAVEALLKQTRPPDIILIVDNASTDGTREHLAERGLLAPSSVELLSLADNLGGAGGFEAGLRAAVSRGACWTWLMDDDACPHPDALERLLERATSFRTIYGSLAVSGSQLAWPLRRPGAARSTYLSSIDEVPEDLAVEFIPFLGLLVSSEATRLIGYPDAGFFIAKDDVEYSLRARGSGLELVVVPQSRIEHPPSEGKHVRILGIGFRSLRIPPWKRYYSARNRILIARRHFGLALYYATLPASLVHLALSLVYGPDRWNQLVAFVAGTLDGLLERKGRRHQFWGLNP